MFSGLMSARRTLLLITASSPAIRLVRRSRVLNFQQITMPYLAAFVSPEWKVIHETLDFLETAGVQNATFNILTPYPGTPLYQRLETEGRILTRDWSKYNGREDVVFQPQHMSPETLRDGYRYANRRFYSGASVYRRLTHSPVGLWWTLPLNLAYAFALRSSQQGETAARVIRDRAGSRTAQHFNTNRAAAHQD
jgi:Domain of unknown function (DUF4070)